MTHRTRAGRFRVAALLAVVLVAALTAMALAHSELETASPADGAVVESTITEVRATFTAPLTGESGLTLRDAAGGIVAEAGIDPTDDQLMVIEVDGLAPGAYEVRWVAIAEDGDIERGTYGFTVVAAPSPSPSPPAETPEPLPTVEPSPSAVPSASVAISPSPTPGTAPSSGSSSTDVLLPILAALVLVLGVGGYLLLRRRPAGR